MSELSEKQRDKLDEDQFAFPKERKEPLNNASHVRNAIARFDQVEAFQTTSATKRGSGSRKPRRNTASRSTRRAGTSLGRKRAECSCEGRSSRASDLLRDRTPAFAGELREQPQRVLDVALERLHEAGRVPAIDDAMVAAQ